MKLNQDELDRLRERKEALLTDMAELEERRRTIFSDIRPVDAETPPAKLAEVLELCPPSEGRGQIKHVGENLKRIAVNVREMNDENGRLIRQSLGLIASTLAIMTQTPDSDLPTYTRRGALTAPAEDPAFTAQRKQLSREV